jgi:hypothetical protein
MSPQSRQSCLLGLLPSPPFLTQISPISLTEGCLTWDHTSTGNLNLYVWFSTSPSLSKQHQKQNQNKKLADSWVFLDMKLRRNYQFCLYFYTIDNNNIRFMKMRTMSNSNTLHFFTIDYFYWFCFPEFYILKS